MPLITGGALTALLARFGLRIPRSVERLMGVASRAATGGTGGLVGEAVRMAGDFGGSGSGSGSRGSAHVRVRDGDSGATYWDRNYNDTNTAWGDTITSMAKMFI